MKSQVRILSPRHYQKPPKQDFGGFSYFPPDRPIIPKQRVALRTPPNLTRPHQEARDSMLDARREADTRSERPQRSWRFSFSKQEEVLSMRSRERERELPGIRGDASLFLLIMILVA